MELLTTIALLCSAPYDTYATRIKCQQRYLTCVVKDASFSGVHTNFSGALYVAVQPDSKNSAAYILGLCILHQDKK